MEFYKYHGTGNDFILIDNRQGLHNLSTDAIARMCHRRFGIGADGLMLLQNTDGYDFGMVYYNADGRESTMCGNGGRCITAFARQLGIISNKAVFKAIDGSHKASILENDEVCLHMNDVKGIQDLGHASVLNTGSPHYVSMVADVMKTEVVQMGKQVRYSAAFAPDGINVNFVQQMAPNQIFVRTYERGVEDETYSCGTGVVAAAIATTGNTIGDFRFNIKTLGGELSVRFHKQMPDEANDVWLTGPAQFVFSGNY